MVPLAPPLKAVLEIRLQMENGISISQSVKNYVQNQPQDEFAKELGLWLFAWETGQKFEKNLSLQRKNLMEILNRGLKGDPIMEYLKDFEKETMEVCKEELEKHLEKLPYVCLVPLMLFQFPAFLLLLIGPLVLNLITILQN